MLQGLKFEAGCWYFGVFLISHESGAAEGHKWQKDCDPILIQAGVTHEQRSKENETNQVKDQIQKSETCGGRQEDGRKQENCLENLREQEVIADLAVSDELIDSRSWWSFSFHGPVEEAVKLLSFSLRIPCRDFQVP